MDGGAIPCGYLDGSVCCVQCLWAVDVVPLVLQNGDCDQLVIALEARVGLDGCLVCLVPRIDGMLAHALVPRGAVVCWITVGFDRVWIDRLIVYLLWALWWWGSVRVIAWCCVGGSLADPGAQFLDGLEHCLFTLLTCLLAFGLLLLFLLLLTLLLQRLGLLCLDIDIHTRPDLLEIVVIWCSLCHELIKLL